ncbi:right-handed parallel beta-helix repeat-containing protein, partial [Patescibacteria group bacterium]|nr:right-handed parallel beta-helix repeat-containing protein [Patescibacteria group bacterium]
MINATHKRISTLLLIFVSLAFIFLNIIITKAATETKITASDGVASDFFGRSVNISGNYAIVGAEGDDDSRGSAYVFFNSGGWSQQKKLVASDRAMFDWFGWSVAIDGEYAFVGAELETSGEGAVYIFKKDQGGANNWGQIKKLEASDGASNDHFGSSVSVSGDYLVVGAEDDDDGGGGSGSAYIFEKDNGGPDNWGEIKKLVASDAAGSDEFGKSVGISGDYIAIGAPYNNSGRGAVYTFYRNEGGVNNWGQQAKLVAGDAAITDYLGFSASIDGDYVIAGAYGDDDNGSISGSAYAFHRTGGSTWVQEDKILPTDGTADDYFGYSVYVSGDNAIIGANYDSDILFRAGSAYIFNRSGTDWNERDKLVASDGAIEDFFGQAVSISGDNGIVAAHWDDDRGNNSGSAYIYTDFSPIDIAADFTDVNFRNCVDTETPSPGINDVEAAAVTDLTCDGMGIQSLAGSQYLTSLDTLSVISNNINDAGFAPASNLTTLTVLDASNNSSLSDLTPIASIPILNTLRAESCNIIDLTPLSGINSLVEVVLSFNDINDISALAGHAGLQMATISFNDGIENLSALVGKNMTRLRVGGNNINSANPNSMPVITAVNFPNMQELSIGPGPQGTITSFSGITNMTQLTNLNLDGLAIGRNTPPNLNFLNNTYNNLVELRFQTNSIEDISIITPARMPNLQTIAARYNSISNISNLNNLLNLSFLDLQTNEITNISSLNNLPNLITLDLGDNEDLNNVSTLNSTNFDTLSQLYIDTTDISNAAFSGICSDGGFQANFTLLDATDLPNVTNFTPIGNLTNLTTLDIDGNDISNIDFLNTLTSLSVLEAGANEISDISVLSGLTTLTRLGLSDNNISNTPNGVTQLGGLINLQTLNLTYNHISDLSPLNVNPAFASGLNFTIEMNEELGFEANYINNLNAIGQLELDGANVTHDINFEYCSNGLDEDGDFRIDANDSYCYPTTYYVDYDTGSLDPNSDCGSTDINPCGAIIIMFQGRDAGLPTGINKFRQVLTDPPFENITVNVRGTLFGAIPGAPWPGDSIQYQKQDNYYASSDLTFQPWGTSHPVLDGGPITLSDVHDITIDGFEIKNENTVPGFFMFGNKTEVENITIKNSYVHDMDAVVLGRMAYGITFYNNVFINNRGTFDFATFGGGPVYETCGTEIFGSDNVSLINNTFINNCDPPGGGLSLKGGDVAILGPTIGQPPTPNSTVKQNLVYNNIGGNSYYFDVAGENINGIPVPGTPADLAALAIIGGDNYMAAADPFVNIAGGANWTAAGSDFGLSPGAYTSYQIGVPDLLTPATDYNGDARPHVDGPAVEAGAIEFTGPFPTIFYVDYDVDPGDLDCSLATQANPCDSVENLYLDPGFQAVLQNPPIEDVYIYVQGTLEGNDSAQEGGLTITSTSISILPWSGQPRPTINAATINPLLEDYGFRVWQDDTLIEGFEVYGNTGLTGIVVMGSDNIARNNYVHGMGTGMGAFGIPPGINTENAQIYNNVLVNNRGPVLCGGIAASGSNNASILNNTLYNNCDYFNADINNFYALGDIALSASNLNLPVPAPTNTTVRNNIVFNNEGGGANTYYYNVGATNVNGFVPAGILTNQTAADHGIVITPSNFSEMTTDPFADSAAEVATPSYTTVGTNLAITDDESVNYETNDPSIIATDFLGNARPVDNEEAGAIEYFGPGPAGPDANFYVDYNVGTGADCQSGVEVEACPSITALFADPTFQTVVSTNPIETVNVFVQGTLSVAPEQILTPMIPLTVTSTEIHIQPWNSNPIIDSGPNNANMFIVGDNITIDGFEIYGSPVEAGLLLIGNNLTAKNNYIHNMAAGVAALSAKAIRIGFDYASSNISIVNNVIANNTDSTVICGGIGIGEVDNVEIINNTLYNNCDIFNADTSSDIALGDIALSPLIFMANSGPTGTVTVKQNLVYNDNGGPENTYFYADNLTVNGVPVGGTPITNKTIPNAMDHGIDPGDLPSNFSTTSGDPFSNSSGGANWTAAGNDFALKSSNYSSYAIGTPDPLRTPVMDYNSKVRPNGTDIEAGAIEYYSSGGTITTRKPRPPACTIQPIGPDLPPNLPVSVYDGQPVVSLNWSRSDIEDLDLDAKVDILIEYLETNPTIGVHDKKLKNIFAEQMYSWLV